MNAGRGVTKEDYISMSKFMFIQICQQAEMSIHLSQFGGDDSRSDISGIHQKGKSISAINNSSQKKKLKSGMVNNSAGNPMFETGAQPVPKGKNQSAANPNKNLPRGRSDNSVLLLDKDVNEL